MAKPLHGRIRILLSAAMTIGLATLPPHLTAQAGSGEPGRPLGAWVGEARKGPFHLSTGPVVRTFRTVAPAFDIGVANARDVRTSPAPAPDSTVSPKKVYAYTLAGATIPFLPAMILVGPGTSRNDSGYEWLGVYLLGGLATLVTVPVAARMAGAQSLGRTLAGTVAGFVAGVLFTGFVAEVPNSELWAIPTFSVTMASLTTVIATSPPRS